jgi:kynurenine formamidase
VLACFDSFAAGLLYLSGDASEYLAGLEAKAIGIDTPSVGRWYDEVLRHGPSTDVHLADSHLPLLENDIIPIEELRNLDSVRGDAATRRAYFFYPPLNFQDTSGSSVRAFAFL